MSDFTISISIPPDNPPITQVDQFGNEFTSLTANNNDKLVQILSQIKQQQQQQQQKDEQQQQQQQISTTTTTTTQISTTQSKIIKFTDHMNLARVEIEQLIFLIDMIRGPEKCVQLCNVDKPFPAEQNQIIDLSLEISSKQRSLLRISEMLKIGGGRMRSTINTMSNWWNDVSTLRSKWRLKGKETDRNQSQTIVSPVVVGVAKSNQISKQKLSIDYGYYTSGSFQDQTEADLSRTTPSSTTTTTTTGVNEAEINIEFPNLPYQNSIYKRLYIDVKSSDSKIFFNHSSNSLIKNYKKLSLNPPKTINDGDDIDEEQQEDEYSTNLKGQPPPPPPTETIIQKCTKLLNKAQKYQFNFELFEQLYKEATNSNTISINSLNSPNPLASNMQPSNINLQSNITSNITGPNIVGGVNSTTTTISGGGNQSLSSSTIGGENIMITENEIRIECGSLNLLIGMDTMLKKEKKENSQQDSDTMDLNIDNNSSSSSSSNSSRVSGSSNVQFYSKDDQDKNRLLFLLKIVLKKISILQLKRSQKQLTLNLSRRNPKIVFGKRSTVSSDDILIKLTSILKHMDTYLRVIKVFGILERYLPIEIKSTPASTVSSSLFIINLIASAQSLKQSMVPIEVSVLQSKIDVVQGNSKSISNKSETLMGIFILNQIQYYLMNFNLNYLLNNQFKSKNNNNVVQSSLVQDLNEKMLIKDEYNQQDESQNKKKFKSNSKNETILDVTEGNNDNNNNVNYFQLVSDEIFNL